MQIEGYRKEDFRKNSWYWNVLVQQTGSWYKAEKEILKSKIRVDPLLLDYESRRKVKSLTF